VTAVEVLDRSLFTDNLAFLNRTLPLVTQNSVPFSGSLTTLRMATVLVKVDSAVKLEQVRTFLALTYPDLTAGTGKGPQTFGEVGGIRAAQYTAAVNVMLLIVGMTLLVAGCSLAIAMGGGMVDRKRPFTLLRVSGTATRILRRVVLLESVLPLVSATVIAALTGFTAAIPLGRSFTPPGTPTTIHLPGQTYYVTMGAGLVISLMVIVLTLPLLERITVPANARFE
jgi:hypothetical protein